MSDTEAGRAALGKERQRKYRAKHRDAVLARSRERQRRKRAEDIDAARAAARERDRAWRRNNPEAHRRRVRKKRGQINAPTRPMPAACECCFRARGLQSLHEDHDHKTGLFRGWLCTCCNTGIAKLGDCVVGLKNAIAYLEGAV